MTTTTRSCAASSRSSPAPRVDTVRILGRALGLAGTLVFLILFVGQSLLFSGAVTIPRDVLDRVVDRLIPIAPTIFQVVVAIASLLPWLIIVLVVLTFAGAPLVRMWRRGRIRALAQRLGLGWEVDDTLGGEIEAIPFALFRRASIVRASDVLVRGAAGARTLLCRLDLRASSSSASDPWVAAIVQLPRQLPAVVIEREGFMDRLGHTLGQHDVEVGDEEFDRRFRLGGDAADVRSIVGPALRQRLLEDLPHDGHFEIVGDRVMCARPASDVSSSGEALLALASGSRAALPGAMLAPTAS